VRVMVVKKTFVMTFELMTLVLLVLFLLRILVLGLLLVFLLELLVLIELVLLVLTESVFVMVIELVIETGGVVVEAFPIVAAPLEVLKSKYLLEYY